MQIKPLRRALSPWSFVLLIVLALIIFLPAIGEYFSARRDLVQLWHSQGRLLSETILRSADRIVAFDKQTARLNREHLLDLGHYIRQLDSLNYPRTRAVRQYARRKGRLISLIMNSRGQIEPQGKNPAFRDIAQKFRHFIINFPPREQVSFLPEEFLAPEAKPGIVVKRSQNRGYIFLLPAPKTNHRLMRDKRPLKDWIEHLAEQASIEYVVVQQFGEVLASSGPVPAKMEVSASAAPQWNLRELENKRVFEYSQMGPAGLQIIISISASALDRLQNNLVRRLILNSLILLLLGSILVVYLIKKQNYSLLQDQFAHIQTYNTSVLENIEEGIIVLDQDKTISVFNRAAGRLLELNEQTVLEKSAHVLERVLNAEMVLAFVQFKTLREIPVSVRHREKQYELLVSANAAYLKNSEQEQQVYIIVLRNNTAQREIEDLRSRKSKLLAMGELASRVAHEIRNPLNAIAVLAQRIHKEFSPAEGQSELRKMSQSIRDESGRINEIIESFLYYARSPELKLAEVQPAAWLDEMTPLLSAMGNVTVQPATEPLPGISIDAQQMKQALINLVKNAVEASPTDEPITVSLHRVEAEIILRIEDNGTGVPKELQEHIFDLYFSAKEKGTGLGLSIVEKIVSAHGGKIRVESPYRDGAQNRPGARFEITLPVKS